MTIQIGSWHDALLFILAGVAVLGIVATIHWKIFAVPLLQKILNPYGERLDIVSRVVQECHPTEYDRAEQEVIRNRRLRGAI